ncbi:hypothetical protein ACFRCI_47055 [Streptomyces sp. NPDC056638]|uniref:hypothetical protein n=1 Tax=Streptomyces sp. NPDC056638 TaxID=3345887 RepID=UPI00369FE8B8
MWSRLLHGGLSAGTRGQKHYSGIYWSATVRDHVIYESRLGSARLLFADFDAGVRSVVAQPFLLKAEVGGKLRKHNPDVLHRWDSKVDKLHFDDGLVEPGAGATAELLRCIDGKRAFPLGVSFQDSDCCTWARDPASFGLQKRRTIRRGHPSMRLPRPGLFGTWRLYAACRRDVRLA